ncbi:hypothetical protein [Nonomuraea sp. NPDC050786]|uniref:hypothetical protein n=1 Tax=Nonomuraea sp. NPDC050786 TaxID=3154840 RepID=UPI0033CF113A
MTTINRQPAKHGRDEESARHLAALLEHLARALAAAHGGNWRSFREHLARVRERSAFTDMCMNGDSFPNDPDHYLATMRAHFPAEWAKALAQHLTQE